MVAAMAVASSRVRTAASSFRSPPATNTRSPAPVTTSTRAGESATSSSAAASSCMVARAMALRASGRSMVSTATPVVTVEPHTARSAHCWIEYQIAESRSPCPVWPRRG